MKWQICISLASLPLTYPILFANYYVGKSLHEVSIKQVIKRNRDLF